MKRLLYFAVACVLLAAVPLSQAERGGQPKVDL
jgi:hypothetical protein